MIFFKYDEITLMNGEELKVLMADAEFALIIPDIYSEEELYDKSVDKSGNLILNHAYLGEPHPMLKDVQVIYDCYGNKIFDHETQPFIERPPETLPKKRGRRKRE